MHQRDRVILDEPGQRGEPIGTPRPALRDDDRVVRLGERPRRSRDRIAVRGGRHRSHARRGRNPLCRARFAQHFTREAQVDRPLRSGIRDRPRAIQKLGHLFGKADLVLPFGRLADQRLLIEHLLPPADGNRARPEPPPFGGRRAARHDDHRDMVAPRVDDRGRAVRQAHVRVQHHCLRASRHLIEPVRHRHGGMFMRDRDGQRQVQPAPLRLDKSFDDRRKIGAGIGEHVADAECFQFGENRPTCGDRAIPRRLAFHASSLWLA